MTIPTELPQETRHFRVNPYISFRGKRGSNILGHHSRMMRKRGKNRLWWGWNPKKAGIFLLFRIIFVSLQPIYNSFSTLLVIFLGINKFKFHSIKQSLIGVFGRRWLGCRSWQQASKSRHNAPTILYYPIDFNRYYISFKGIKLECLSHLCGSMDGFFVPKC